MPSSVADSMSGPEVVAVGVGAHPALQVQPQAVGVGVSDDEIVLVDDEHVPLAVDALPPAIVGEGGVEALGPVPADGVVDEELGVLGGGGLGRDGGHHSLRYPLSLGGGESGLRSGDGGDGVLDYPVDLALGQTHFRPGHLRQHPADGLLHVGCRGSVRHRRVGQLRAHDLLDLGAGQPGVVTPAGDQTQADEHGQRRQCHCDPIHRQPGQAFLLYAAGAATARAWGEPRWHAPSQAAPLEGTRVDRGGHAPGTVAMVKTWYVSDRI